MGINQKNKKSQYVIYLKPILFLRTTWNVKQILLALKKKKLQSTLNMWFFNIININSKNIFILIIELNNIYKFNKLRFSLWLLLLFFDKDNKMYTWLCFHPMRFKFCSNLI